MAISDTLNKILQAVIIAALVWVGNAVKDLVVAVIDHGQQIEQLWENTNDHMQDKEAHHEHSRTPSERDRSVGADAVPGVHD